MVKTSDFKENHRRALEKNSNTIDMYIKHIKVICPFEGNGMLVFNKQF